jgi:hypothetical protein
MCGSGFDGRRYRPLLSLNHGRPDPSDRLLGRYSHWMPSRGRNTAEGMDEALG